MPGRQERTIWDSLGGTREAGEPIGQPARHEGGTREAGKDHLDCHERAQAWPASPRIGFRVIIFIRDKARRL